MSRRWNSETLGITRRVLAAPENARLEVPLKPHFPGILTALREVGECLIVALNETATLGVFGHYPSLTWEGGEATATDGSLLLNTGEWKSATAIRTKSEAGERHSIEFRSVSGQVVHRVCAASRSDMRRYRDLIGSTRRMISAYL